jgi:conjugative relaxase-like TrwC/TraI family protein
MLTISKPLSAGQAAAYHASEFTSAEQSYYTQSGEVRGEWHGRLAAEWGLTGEVSAEAFSRLASGQHPETAEQLVRYQQGHEYENDAGDTVRTMEHRAGWDATFSAPKSVSLTALVGGDERIREAHWEAMCTALDEIEHYVQARIGGNAPAQTTGKWVAACFEHDSSRPVDGYSAPQLHTHVVFFNLTETEDGKAHAVQPQELYRSQQYATALYRSELAWRLRQLGYEVEQGKTGAPEIRGYSTEYLEASSPRRQQIREHMAEHGVDGAGAAQIAAHRTRDAKQALSREETLKRHREIAEVFGNQPVRVVEAAQERTRVADHSHDARLKPAQTAVTFARDRNLERDAVVDERALMRDALKRSMGQATFAEVREHFEARITRGDFLEVQSKGPARRFTTPEMIALERENIERMQAGQGKYAPLVSYGSNFAHLSDSQRQVVETIIASRDQIVGLQGVAGAGKTTSLAAIREATEGEGYQVEGFAPTSRAAQQLGEAGIPSTTLQHHLAKGEQPNHGAKHLYFVDESSLTSTKQIHEFFERLKRNDRVVLVGDVRQHQSVDAGKPYEQLQQEGMLTARLEEVVRQKDPALKETVEQLARGEAREAIGNLKRQDRVHEIADAGERMRTIAAEYAANPAGTLVISPDNRSREELNRLIHQELQQRGWVDDRECRAIVRTARQDMTGVDRRWAAQYEPGDVVRYSKGSQAIGINAGEYATVEGSDRERNLLIVERENGQRIIYDPRRLQGVTVYREGERSFSEGDRIQFTAPDKERHVANRELGTIENIDKHGIAQIRMDSGETVRVSLEDHPHLDHGYVVTSHSSQGVTADRVLIHIDSEQVGEQLVNSRLAYVAVSRARYDAQIYTNEVGNLGDALSREVTHSAALEDWKHNADASNCTGSRDCGEEKDHGLDQAENHGYAMEVD